VITEVVIRSHAPSYGGLFARSRLLGRLVTSMHVTTSPSVVEKFVLLRRGERCSILLRRETERILRAQPFIADATVTAFADGVDAVRIEVVTLDESSVVGSIGFKSRSPYLRALTFGNANFRGLGIYLMGGWREGFELRDTFIGGYRNYQLFGRPYQLHLSARRRDLGYDFATSVAYPFFSDVQPRAWRASGGASDDLIAFRSPGEPRVSLGLRRQWADAGGFLRVGVPGRLGLVGASVSSERAMPAASGVLVTDTGLVPDATGALDDRYQPYRATRINLLLGYRQVNFLRVNGFDALTGAQDVRRGVQIGATLGRALPASDSPRDEVYAAVGMYGGVGSRSSFAGLEVLAEGRRDQRRDEWDGLLVSGRLAWYLRPHSRHTLISSLEYGAGLRQRLPFQLSLGDRRGGVRGYDRAELGGGQRFVARLEERWRVGNIRGTADAGVALFADVGRLWTVDAPLGRNTGYKPSVGVSLLGALPPRSRRLWRLDFALPLRPEAGARFIVRMTSEDRTRTFWLEPNDLRRNHERSAPLWMLQWP
jgi:hypothetical protein